VHELDTAMRQQAHIIAMSWTQPHGIQSVRSQPQARICVVWWLPRPLSGRGSWRQGSGARAVVRSRVAWGGEGVYHLTVGPFAPSLNRPERWTHLKLGRRRISRLVGLPLPIPKPWQFLPALQVKLHLRRMAVCFTTLSARQTAHTTA